MTSRWAKVGLVIQVILIFLLGGLVFWWMMKGQENEQRRCQFHLRRASIFLSNHLWREAVKEYQNGGLTCPKDRARNLWLKAGELCYEKLEDYQCLVESYLSAQALGYDFSQDSERASQLVSALKMLGKDQQAKNFLNQLTALVPESEKKGKVVAKIGEEEITLEELKKSLEKEPKQIQERFAGKGGLKEYLKHFLFTRFLYQSALSEGFLNQRIEGELARLKENFLAQKYYQARFLEPVEITEQELKEYYQAHKDRYRDAQGRILSFEQARAKLEEDLKQQKAQKLSQEWFGKQLEEKRVKIYESGFEDTGEP